MTTEKALVVAPPIEPVRVSPQAVEAARQDIAILQELVGTLLEAGWDYGDIPGIPGKALFDPGAAKVMAGFNCYSTHVILAQRDDGEMLTFIIEAKLISRATQEVVATGVGAASTKETKWAYRWVNQKEAEAAGYTGEALKGLKRQERKSQYGPYFVYRIPNPDPGELLNTLVKMAAKRAEQDAVKSLPGVGTALAKLFEGKLTRTNGYAHFWAEVRRLGYSDTEAHELLGVKSLKDWEAAGKSLDDALAKLRQVRQAEGEEAQHMGAAAPPTVPPTTLPATSPKTPVVASDTVAPVPSEGQGAAAPSIPEYPHAGAFYQEVYRGWNRKVRTQVEAAFVEHKVEFPASWREAFLYLIEWWGPPKP